MSNSSDTVLTQEWMDEIAAGKVNSVERLMNLVYDELHSLATRMLRRENPGHTLQSSALVNEAYMRLAKQQNIDWQGRTHFLAVGAQMMRRILVDHARGKKAEKRGGGWRRIQLHDDLRISNRESEDVIAVEEALEKLSKLDERQAKIVELRFYGGLTVEEVAEVLGVSKRTVEAEWTMIKAWMRRELSGNNGS